MARWDCSHLGVRNRPSQTACVSHPIRHLRQESETDLNYRKNKEPVEPEQENSTSVVTHTEALVSQSAISVGLEMGAACHAKGKVVDDTTALTRGDSGI